MNDGKQITFNTTNRGFTVGEFTDRYGTACSVQDSSIATEDAMWLGCNNANPKILIPGKGWHPLPFPDDTVFTTRMHLTTDHAKQLIEVLQRFVDTGTVSPPTTDFKGQ